LTSAKSDYKVHEAVVSDGTVVVAEAVPGTDEAAAADGLRDIGQYLPLTSRRAKVVVGRQQPVHVRGTHLLEAAAAVEAVEAHMARLIPKQVRNWLLPFHQSLQRDCCSNWSDWRPAKRNLAT
jgi:hypothetical protein